MNGTIIFSHGKDGDPWGMKIVAMAKIAERHGLHVESVDYRGIEDVAERQAKLMRVCTELAAPPVLVGSSLGGHLAATASMRAPVRGLFLLAPAFFMQGWEQRTPQPPPGLPIDIVHGWKDDVVPIDNSIRFARLHQCTLHAIASDHRLADSIERICEYLDDFLRRLPVAS